MGGSEIQDRELAAGWKGLPVALTQVFLQFSFSLFLLSSFLFSLSLLHIPPYQETTPAVPESPVSHLAPQVSAATGLRGHSLGTPWLPQLAKGGITVLNA